MGLFSEKGNLKYYKHPLFFPYLDTKRRSFYFQARAIDSTVVPKELNLRGTVPYPYNVSALDEKPGWVYLCEGVVDTLTFLGQRIAAIGIPGVGFRFSRTRVLCFVWTRMRRAAVARSICRRFLLRRESARLCLVMVWINLANCR